MERFLIVGGGALSGAIAAACSLRAPTTWITRHSSDPTSLPLDVQVVRTRSGELPDVARYAGDGAHIVWALGGSYPSSVQGRYHEALERELQPMRASREGLARANAASLTYLSSGGAVYGDLGNDGAHTEVSPLRPVTDYGRLKARSEQYMIDQIAPVVPRLVIARPGTVYGLRSRDRSFGLVEGLIADALAGRPTQLFGGADVLRDFVHTDDVALAVVNLAVTKATGAFNIATGVGTSLSAVADTLAGVLGSAVRLQWLPRRDCDVHANVLGIEKLRRTVSFDPMPLADGLKQAVARLDG